MYTFGLAQLVEQYTDNVQVGGSIPLSKTNHYSYEYSSAVFKNKKRMINFNKKVQEQFVKMSQTGKLFRVDLTGQQIWDLYISSFSKEDNPIFRDPNSTSKNCNHCNNFIRRYGNIVSLDENYNVSTMFDVDAEDEFKNTVVVLSGAIKSSKITEVFFETFNELNKLPYESCAKTNTVFQLGVKSNPKRYTKEESEKYGVVKANEVRTFNHLHLVVDKQFVDVSGNSVESIMGNYRDAKNVFQRAMEEISLDTLKLVRDLINQGSLLDGQTHLFKVEQFIPLKQEYDGLSAEHRDNWCWTKSYKLPFAKFKNELIGVLCSELSEGEELNKACQSWNKRVDPANYMKATAPITKRQIEDARLFVEENGYTESFDRRFATIDDIKVSEILHSNVGVGNIKSVSIFDGVKSTSTRHKRAEFDGVEEVGIDKFMSDILPTCSSVEAFFGNTHQGNLVSLTTANNPDSKPIFKWSNNYSWTFNGNLAGKSQLTEMVEAKGGRTDGVFRFTHSWNELEPNQSLMDLHVFMPSNKHEYSTKVHDFYGSGRRVGWNQRQDSSSGGTQDVDYTNAAPKGYVPVENITFPVLSKMPDGKYICKIHNWSFRLTGGRGKAEISFGGDTYQYEYPATKNKEWVTIAEVILANGKFSIEHILTPINESSKEIYGLETNQFHKVNLVCLSPNHWGENNVGNKHYMFMLDGCKSDNSIRSFHNENLISELAEHRKVLEILGTTNMIEPTDKQLSGLGFNATVRDELVVKLQGTHKRMLKIKF